MENFGLKQKNLVLINLLIGNNIKRLTVLGLETVRAVHFAYINNVRGLSPCDFDLIPKMKEPLRGIRFRTVPEILQAVDRSIPTINTTGATKGILRLPHRWQRVVHNAGDYNEGQ